MARKPKRRHRAYKEWAPSFRTDFAFSGKSLSSNSLNKMRYILWVMALLEACDVTNNGRTLGRDLGFYQELEIR